MRHRHLERKIATDSRFSAWLRRQRSAALVPSRRRCRGQTAVTGDLLGARLGNVDALLPALHRTAAHRGQRAVRESLRRTGLSSTAIATEAPMKTGPPNLLGAAIRDYFTDHLPRLRGTSPHTIHSYRDSIVLLLRFLSHQQKKLVTGLDLTDLDPPAILSFLSHLEQERKNGVSTRNVRLSAIHAFFHFVAARNPEHLDLAQRVLGIPFKRAQQRVIDYLEYEEIDSVLKAIDRTRAKGSRDDVLLATMCNTGARVQEIADVRARDLQLIKPFQVRLFGKGRKERYCPIWPQTAAVLRSLCEQRKLDFRSDAHVFVNQRGAQLSRFGIRHILANRLDLAAEATPNLRKKRLHPHSVRHSTAVALLKSGVDLSTISHLLGHASPATTNRYAKVH